MFIKISVNSTISKLVHNVYSIGYLIRSIHNSLATIQKSKMICKAPISLYKTNLVTKPDLDHHEPFNL